MKKNKFVFNQPKYIAFLLSVLAIVFFILTEISKKTGLAVFFAIIAGLSFVGGCVLLYLSYRENKLRKNFFLYDRRRDCNIAPGELTFRFACENLEYFLSSYTENTLSLYEGFPKKLTIELDATPSLWTPIAYKMLYDMSALEDSEILARFSALDEENAKALCRAIRDADDKELADFIFSLKCNIKRDAARIVPFFKRNRERFEKRFMHYVLTHLEDFILDE